MVELDLVERRRARRTGRPRLLHAVARHHRHRRSARRSRQTTTAGGVPMSYGTVHVSNQVVGFARKLVATGEILEVLPLALPPQRAQDPGRLVGDPAGDHRPRGDRCVGPPGCAHAAEHAAIGLLPLVATCDRWDVGGVSTAHHPDTGTCRDLRLRRVRRRRRDRRARLPSDPDRWLLATLETVSECPCTHGCPSCVQSPKCGNGNEPLDKPGAVALLSAMLGTSWG